ncbi:MAG: cupin domain-containing protein [Acidobacteriota bacterium]|nr:cupin domain-containing protein [Acidobacteriota bacterium]
MQQTEQSGVNPAEELIGLGGLSVRFLVTGAESNGSVAMFELTVLGGEKLMAPAHSHDHYEETIYGIQGFLRWTVDGSTVEVGPGQALCIPRGAVHRFDNDTEQDVKCLCVITPAAIGPEYFREVSDVMKAAAGGPPDKGKLVEIMLRHGLTPSAPAAK